MKTRMVLGILTLALLTLPAPTHAMPAPAQTPGPVDHGDGRWTPYVGCWRLLAENLRNPDTADLIRSATQSATTPAVTVCVQPVGARGTAAGVTMTTFADGKRVLEQTIVADGTGHPVSESGCVGTQTSDWSHDGLRLFTRVEMACNDRPKQTVSGLTLFAKGPAWVDIQAMNADGDQQVRIRRYVRTLDQPEGLTPLPADVTGRAIIDAQNAATRKLSLEDITEASAKLSSQAVEAAIVETESRFNLNSRVLVRLADAGVSPNVIDLMVAQSFPTHFRVESPMTVPLPPVAASTPSMIPGVPSAQYPTAYPFYPYGVYDPYSYYNSYYSFYYSPFAYPYYWGSGYYRAPVYYINNGSVITGGSDGSSGGSSRDRGQVVNGRGYTRVHAGSEPDATTTDPNQHTTTSTPRTVHSAPPNTPNTSTDSSSSSSGSSTPSGSSGSTSSSGSGGVSSSGGYSGGGGGGDTGRTAQPR